MLSKGETLKRVLRRGSDNGVSKRCLERPLGEHDPFGVRPMHGSVPHRGRNTGSSFSGAIAMLAVGVSQDTFVSFSYFGVDPRSYFGWDSAKRAGVKWACPNKVMAHI